MTKGLKVISTINVKSYHDRRDVPRYSYEDVARWLHLPRSTVASWFFGQTNFKPLFIPADKSGKMLSFYNLIEAHAVSWTKQKYPKLQTAAIRNALHYVSECFPLLEKPLVTKKFSTDGKNLMLRFLDEHTPTINASHWGQTALPFVNELLELIEYDDKEFARLVYPQAGGKLIVINPKISSGQPVVRGTGVLASVIWQRARVAREPIERLERDYRLGKSEIEAAINYIEAA